MDATSASVITAYEKRIAKLESDKLSLTEQTQKRAGPNKTYEECFRTAINFLANQLKLWRTKRIEDRRAVLKLTLSDKLAHH